MVSHILLMNTRPTLIKRGLVGLWKFDDVNLTQQAVTQSFTRSSTAIDLSKIGAAQQVASGVPRFEGYGNIVQEGTINLIPSQDIGTWSSYNNSLEPDTSRNMYGQTAQRMIRDSDNQYYSCYRDYEYVNVSAAQQYTFSGDVYIDEPGKLGNAEHPFTVRMNVIEWNSSTQAVRETPVQINESGRHSITITPLASTTKMSLRYGLEGLQGAYITVVGHQCEAKDHATPFTVGTRQPVYEKYGLKVEEGTTNLLTANQANPGNLTGFVKFQGPEVMTIETGEQYRKVGTGALKVITPGNANYEGFYTNIQDVAPSLAYTHSLWLCGSGTIYLQIDERNAANQQITFTNSPLITLTSTPTRYSVTRTFSGLGVKTTIKVYAAGIQSATIYASGLQIEQKAYPTAWQNPADGARAAEVVSIPTAGTLSPQQGTIEMLINVTNDFKSATGYKHLFNAATGNSRLYLFRDPAGYLYFTTRGDNTGAGILVSAADLSVGLHRISCRWSSTGLRMFIDGVGGSNGAATDLPVAINSNLYLGCSSSSSAQVNCQISDVHISNIARSDAQMASRGVLTPLPVDVNTTLYMPLSSDMSSTVQSTSQRLTDYSKPTVNLLTPNQASCGEDGTIGGFSAQGGGTVSVTSSPEWADIGSRSIKVVTGGEAAQYQGFRTDSNKPTPVEAGKTYTFSLVMKGATSFNNTLQIYDQTGTQINVGVSAVTTTPTRFSKTFTVPAGVTGVWFKYTVYQTAVTYYADSLMLNEGSTALPWEMPPNHGTSGSTAAIDTNDGVWTAYGRQYGPDDYDIVPYSPGLDSLDAFTVMAVITANSAGGNGAGRIFCKDLGGELQINMAGNNVSVSADGTAAASTDTPIVFGNTYLVEAKFNKSLPSDQLRLLVNGALKGVNTKTISITNYAKPYYLGNRADATRYFDGTICALLYWPNRYLSDGESKAVRKWLKLEMAKRGVTINV